MEVPQRQKERNLTSGHGGIYLAGLDHCSPSPLQHEVIHRGHAVVQLQPVSLTCTARCHLN